MTISTAMQSRLPALPPALAALGLALAAWAADAEQVHVAVAANFTAPMKKIAAAFAAETGHKAELSFGTTGKFYAQIFNGAPFQLLLSADEATPAKLERAGLAISNTRFTYALGRLALSNAPPHFAAS